MLTQALSAAAAAFLASFVECVEALTVVLALGAARGWRAPLAGTAASLAVLAGIAAGFGPLLSTWHLSWLRLVVGLLVLLFGLRWLRKAILRAVGVIPLHDEAASYAQARAFYTEAARPPRWDWTGFTGAFQVVMLEGSEVAFIVLAAGGGRAGLAPAALGAAIALAVVVALGLALHEPLTRIPENALKCAVGVLLTAFGTFWTGEAIGAAWPGGDWSLLLITGFWSSLALMLIATTRVRA